MIMYRVAYVIDIDADTPEEAARITADILADGGAQRGVYDVTDGATSTVIDLAGDDEGF